LIVLDRHFEIPALKLPRFMIEPVAAPIVDGNGPQQGWERGSGIPVKEPSDGVEVGENVPG
jgi:hypothetical protein